MPSHHIRTISQSTFDSVLARYVSAAPASLHDLDALRYDTIPAAVAKRPVDTRHLTKSEVEKLVEWKLKHGTFRPQLLSLVQSNPAPEIQSTTTSAFNLISSQPVPALKTLIKLKGIGPATASLLLSVASPDSIPFFSDELFRWCVWDEAGVPGGWKRKIKYNLKEYEQVLEGVDRLIEKLGVRAVDVERVAWVLGKEGVDVGDGADEEYEEGGAKVEVDEKQEEEVKEPEAVEAKSSKKDVKKSTKRKASVSKTPAEGTRKSTRTKK